jgi:hypothetical protein
VTRVDHCAAPVARPGSEIERPADRHSMSIRQPCPAIFGPPMMNSSGRKTSFPVVGPLMKGIESGSCRLL